jgi:hypothetical protein
MRAAVKLIYERWKTEYVGESGPPWVAFLREHEAKGWELRVAMVIEKIDDKRFRGRVEFRRPLLLVR